MSVTAVVGLQWGDEAKGKIVDLLTDQHDVVVRYLGGNNAGHTVMFGGETYKLSLLPSGILRQGVTNVVATGVVINPKAFLDEIKGLTDRGVRIGELLISDRAHVIFPYHMAEEAILEARRGDKAIGTTMRGIGTCYRDKIGRTHAIRMGDLYRPEFFRERLGEVIDQKHEVLCALNSDFKRFDADEIFAEYTGYAEKLKPHVCDTTSYLHKALAAGKSILFEGAQGSLLDIDHGTFPYVTSSNSSGCGIHVGSGVPARAIDRMIGVVKAYTTRVGGGPCPTELHDETGQHIRDEGHEYGTVTGRPRRCGWFDAVATGYGARISGVDGIAVMLLDVLSKLDELQICEAYEIDGERTTDFPSHVEDLAKAKPVYRTLPGWNSDITGLRKLTDLPKQARAYVDAIGELVGFPVQIVSVGPDREQTMFA
jgi:adenylosuccinate synthase